MDGVDAGVCGRRGDRRQAGSHQGLRDGRSRARRQEHAGDQRVEPVRPGAGQLRELAGTYASDEAETVLTVALSGESLVIKRRPDTVLKLTPVYADTFEAPQLGLVIFRRESGRITGLSVSQDRVWDLRFMRENAAARSASQARLRSSSFGAPSAQN